MFPGALRTSETKFGNQLLVIFHTCGLRCACSPPGNITLKIPLLHPLPTRVSAIFLSFERVSDFTNARPETLHPKTQGSSSSRTAERDVFMGNLLVRVHFIVEMIWWTGLAPREFEFPVPGSLISTFLVLSLLLPSCATAGFFILAYCIYYFNFKAKMNGFMQTSFFFG